MDWKKEAKLFLLFLKELELTLDLSLRLLLLLLLLRNLGKRLLVLSEALGLFLNRISVRQEDPEQSWRAQHLSVSDQDQDADR